MKKTLITILTTFLLAPSVFALGVSPEVSIMAQNDMHTIGTFTIMSDTANDVKKDFGINIIIGESDGILWNANTVTATGTAVTNGKLAASFTPEYLNGYKILHIPVLADWVMGETANINGLILRTYNRQVNYRPFSVDNTGDLVEDFQAGSGYQVNTTYLMDTTPTYPMTDVKYTIDATTHAVKLTWKNPPDYDFVSLSIERVLIRDGQTLAPKTLMKEIVTEQYIDNDVKLGDSILYRLIPYDYNNPGTITELRVDVPLPETPVVTPPATEPTTQPPTAPAEGQKTELQQLTSLYYYYKVRQAIKCLAPTSSACLWAKIDLVYTQEKIGKNDVTISLSDNDLRLMKLRVQWPEDRYQTKCVEAETPDNTCPALKKSLDRIHYFIDQE